MRGFHEGGKGSNIPQVYLALNGREAHLFEYMYIFLRKNDSTRLCRPVGTGGLVLIIFLNVRAKRRVYQHSGTYGYNGPWGPLYISLRFRAKRIFYSFSRIPTPKEAISGRFAINFDCWEIGHSVAEHPRRPITDPLQY